MSELGPESSYWSYERVIGRAVIDGELDAEEASRALANYEAWINHEPTGEPITDSDTLASPLGHCAVQLSIFE